MLSGNRCWEEKKWEKDQEVLLSRLHLKKTLEQKNLSEVSEPHSEYHSRER
jgi:hypothetical protein